MENPAQPDRQNKQRRKAAPVPDEAELRRLRRVLKALDSEPCQCPLRPVPGTLARTWNDLCYRVERGIVETAEQKRRRREAVADGERVPREEPQASPEGRLAIVVLATEACFCATCHDHPVPVDTWLWLMEQADPQGMKGPPLPAPASIPLEDADGEEEARARRVALYEARRRAGYSLFHPGDAFAVRASHAPSEAFLRARRKRKRLAAFCARLLGEESGEAEPEGPARVAA